MPTGLPTTNSTNKYPNVKQLSWAINYPFPTREAMDECKQRCLTLLLDYDDQIEGHSGQGAVAKFIHSGIYKHHHCQRRNFYTTMVNVGQDKIGPRNGQNRPFLVLFWPIWSYSTVTLYFRGQVLFRIFDPRNFWRSVFNPKGTQKNVLRWKNQEKSRPWQIPLKEIRSDDKNKVKPKLESFPCQKCCVVAKTEYVLKMHMFAHTDDEKTGFRCKFCNGLFKDYNNHARHVHTQHTGQIFKL